MKSAWSWKQVLLVTVVAGFAVASAVAGGARNGAVAANGAAPAGPRAQGLLSQMEQKQPSESSGYHLLKTIPVPGDTFWDYLTFERGTNRLFITHGDEVQVLDVDSGKIVGTMGGMEGIHGVVLAPKFNRGFVTDGRAAKVWIFNLKTLKVTGSAPADKDADGDVYDPASKRVFTFNGDSHTSTVIDAKTGKVVGHIELGGDPEFPVADGRGHVYDNIESTSEIIEIDSHTMKITHRWPLAPGTGRADWPSTRSTTYFFPAAAIR